MGFVGRYGSPSADEMPYYCGFVEADLPIVIGSHFLQSNPTTFSFGSIFCNRNVLARVVPKVHGSISLERDSLAFLSY
jgi:hypothetical protein